MSPVLAGAIVAAAMDPIRDAPRRWLVRAAAAIVGLHVVALALAVVAMRPGTAIFPAAERAAYLAGRPLGWALGWAAWMLCALALVAFLAILAEAVPARALINTAVTVAAAGAAVDLTCDTVYITAFPALAAEGPTTLFLAAERALGAVGMVVANGLYSVAVLLATLGLRDLSRIPALLRWLGYLTFAGGMLMVTAGFTGDPRQLEIATGLAIAPFLAWTVGVARSLSR